MKHDSNSNDNKKQAQYHKQQQAQSLDSQQVSQDRFENPLTCSSLMIVCRGSLAFQAATQSCVGTQDSVADDCACGEEAEAATTTPLC